MPYLASRRTLPAAQRLITKVALAATVLSSAFTGLIAAEDVQHQPAAASPSTAFTDISDSYARKEIEALAQAGILSGYDQGRFFPQQPITRAELAKILVLATGRTESSNSLTSFLDVPPDSWYRGYVAALVEAGITEGTSPTAFSPDALVTREELVVLFTRAMGLSGKAEQLPAEAVLADLPMVADWAKPSVILAYKTGFINGMDNGNGSTRFAPKENAERQALALLAYSCWTRQAEFTAKAEELLRLTPVSTPSSQSPQPSATVKAHDNGYAGQAFLVIKAEAFDRTTVMVTLDKLIENASDVKSFSFANGLEITGAAVKAGTPTVVLTTGNQTPDMLYPLYYDGGNTFIDIKGSPDFLTVIDHDVTGLFKLSQADTSYGPLTGSTSITGDLYIDAPRVKLHNVRVSGNLIITEHVGSEAVYLENVQVDGETLVLGSGKGGIHLTGALLSSLVVNNPEEAVDIVAEKGTRVQQATLISSAAVKQIIAQDPASVFDKVRIPQEAPAQSYVSLQGTFGTVDVQAPIYFQLTEGNIASLNVTASSKFSGQGTITNAYLQADPLSFEKMPLHYTLGNGIAPPAEAPPKLAAAPLLKAAVISNGKIALEFSRKAEALTLEDFHIEATLGEEPFSAADWTYDAITGTISFPELSADSIALLRVGIKAKHDAFAGHLRLILSGFSGRLLNVNGLPAEGVRITFRSKTEAAEVNKAPSGEAVTDKNGNYAIRLSSGVYTGELNGEGFLRTYMEAIAQSGSYSRNVNASAIGTLKESELRIVLSWGIHPRDLDAHLIGPDRSGIGGNLHTWYKNRIDRYSAFSDIELDVDDSASFGPETITIRKPANGHYLFYTHKYSGVRSMFSSVATVKVYQGIQTEPLHTYSMPLIPTSKEYWVVFKMTVSGDGITFTPMNEFTDSNPWDNVGKLGNNTELRSSVYTINNGRRRIEKVPQGTSAEALKQVLSTVDPGAHFELYEPDRTSIRTGKVEKFDVVIITAANGITKREFEVLTETAIPAPASPAIITNLYASSDNSVTNAVYSQSADSGANTASTPIHIPSSAPNLLIQFNQEISATQEELQVYVHDALLSKDSIRVLPEGLLSLNLQAVPIGQAAAITISNLKTNGEMKTSSYTVHIFRSN